MARSRFMPSAKGSSVAILIASMHLKGAMAPRNLRALAFAKSSKTEGESALACRSLTLRTGSFSFITFFAKISASAFRSPSMMASRMPISFARAAFTGTPEVIISSAACTPARRGSRCVPPAPGRSPSFTSGSPNFAAAVAIRK